MKIQDRQMLAEGIFNNCLNVLECKGKAYSGTEDVLSNFKINAERLGLTKYQVWQVYFNKHIDSINNAIKVSPASPMEETEGMEGRITDVINYAVILQALLTEDKSSHYIDRSIDVTSGIGENK